MESEKLKFDRDFEILLQVRIQLTYIAWAVQSPINALVNIHQTVIPTHTYMTLAT